MPSDLLLFATVIVVTLAAAVKGSTGFGFFLMALPVVTALLGARTAVVMLTIPGMLANALILFKAPRSSWERSSLWLAGGLVAGTVMGASVVRAIPPSLLTGLVGGIALVILATRPLGRWLGIRTVDVSAIPKRVDVSVGWLAGAMGGSTGLFGPILAPYLLLRRLDADAFAALLSAFFLLGGILQAATYAASGLFTWREVVLGAVTCVPMTGGTWVGIRLRSRLDSGTFRSGVTVLVVVMSLNLLRQALLG